MFPRDIHPGMMRKKQNSNMLRHFVHAVVAALLWVVFIYYWRIVFRQPMNPDTRTALMTLAILTFATTVYLSGWVVHNIQIHRRVRSRRQRRRETPGPTRDYLGRRIVLGDTERLRRAHHIEVDVFRASRDDHVLEQKVFKPID
jgi:hypothetical protein